jgi:hypothetical protein
MKKWLIFAAILLVVATGIQSCGVNNCGCPKPYTPKRR